MHQTFFKKTLPLLLLIAAGVYSCKKDKPAPKDHPAPTTPSADTGLLGTWIHIENHGTFDNLPGDPPRHSTFTNTLDGSDTLILRSDSTFNSTVNFADGWHVHGTFSVDSINKITMYEISVNDTNEAQIGYSTASLWFQVKGDTLLLYHTWEQPNAITYQAAVLIRR